MVPLKYRFQRAFVGSILGAVTGATVATLSMAAVLLNAIVTKDPGATNLGMLYLVIVLIAATLGAFWGILFGSILGFCNFSRPMNALLGLAFGYLLCWYLSDTFYGFPLLLRLFCFPLMVGACFFGPLFINRFVK